MPQRPVSQTLQLVQPKATYPVRPGIGTRNLTGQGNLPFRITPMEIAPLSLCQFFQHRGGTFSSQPRWPLSTHFRVDWLSRSIFMSASPKRSICAAFAVMIATPAVAAEIITVTPTNPPTNQAQGPAPFTFRGTTGSRTQQVYSSSFFNTAQTLTSLAFRSTPSFLNGANYDNVIITLSTTAFGDESGTPLSSFFADNIGTDVKTVFSGPINFAAPTTTGFEYRINLTNGFAYDPSMGNLLLDVLIPAGTRVDGPGFFLASYDTANVANDGVFSVNAVFDGNATSGISNTAAAITEFTGTPLVSAIPEPASWAMMITGFGFIGAAVRKRKAVATGPAIAA
jgi:PEP-CTERM motif